MIGCRAFHQAPKVPVFDKHCKLKAFILETYINLTFPRKKLFVSVTMASLFLFLSILQAVGACAPGGWFTRNFKALPATWL